METDQMVKVGVIIEDTGEIVQMLLPSENSEDDTEMAEIVPNSRNTRERNKSRESAENRGKSLKSAEEDNEKSLFIWTAPSTELLLSLYEKNIDNFNAGERRHQIIWSGIAAKMNSLGYKVSWAQCQSKLSGMKKVYKKYLDNNRNSTSERRSSWPYFKRIHAIFGSSDWVRSLEGEAGPSSSNGLSTDSVQKSRKDLLGLHNLWNEMKEERRKEREFKQRRHNEKMKKISELIAQKKRHHEEMMEMMHLILANQSK